MYIFAWNMHISGSISRTSRIAPCCLLEKTHRQMCRYLLFSSCKRRWCIFRTFAFNLQVGFLNDWRRMNVAITRAKRGLIVLGNAPTLEKGDPHWAALVKQLRTDGCVVPSVQSVC